MKKFLLIFTLIVLSMSIIISCDNANKTPESSNSEDNTTSEIVLLDFTEVVNSRGITGFPNDSPFYSIEGANDTSIAPTYGFWMNCNVMRSLPIFPGLKSVNASANAYINSIKGKSLKGYGFTLTVRIAEKTDDGVFISYDIDDGNGHTSGTIEYYYSIKEKKFSYREIVMPLFGNTGGDQIFVFEILNVPVEKGGNSFSFKAGELYKNGSSFNHISFFNGDYGSGKLNEDERNITKLQFEDAKIVMNYQGDTVCSTEYEKYYLNYGNPVELKDLIGKESISLDNTKRATYSMGKILYFLREIYHDTFEKHGFSTIDDFNATRLSIKEDKKNVLYKDVENHMYYGLAFPLSFNLKKNIGACLYNNNATVNKSSFPEILQTQGEQTIINGANIIQGQSIVQSELKGESIVQPIKPEIQVGYSSYSFNPFVLEQFKKCFEFDGDIKTFDQFVSLMFKNLGLTEYAESAELRKNLLSNSYN